MFSYHVPAQGSPIALRVVNHLLVRPRDPRFSCPPGNPAHAAHHTTRANGPQRTRSTTCLPRPPVPVLARLAGLRYQAPRNLRLPHRLSGLSNLLHAPSVRPPNPPRRTFGAQEVQERGRAGRAP